MRFEFFYFFCYFILFLSANLNEITLGTILKNVNDSFESQNEVCSQTICSQAKSDDEDDPYWKFALISSTLLESLNDCLFEINENNCYISVKDELLLSKLVQLTVCFGIHYNLEDNVGVSIEKLSKYGANITKKRGRLLFPADPVMSKTSRSSCSKADPL